METERLNEIRVWVERFKKYSPDILVNKSETISMLTDLLAAYKAADVEALERQVVEATTHISLLLSLVTECGTRTERSLQRHPVYSAASKWLAREPTVRSANMESNRQVGAGGSGAGGVMRKHKCCLGDYCICNPQGLEPDETCPMHGTPWPPRCVECGRMMKWRQP